MNQRDYDELIKATPCPNLCASPTGKKLKYYHIQLIVGSDEGMSMIFLNLPNREKVAAAVHEELDDLNMVANNFDHQFQKINYMLELVNSLAEIKVPTEIGKNEISRLVVCGTYIGEIVVTCCGAAG
jgi:hypothetical protein